MQYTEQELIKLVNDVESLFTADLVKAEEDFKAASAKPVVDGAAQPEVPLAKAEEEKEKKPAEDSKESKPEAKDESKEEKAPEAPKADEKAPESKEAAAPEAAAPADQAAAPEANGQPSAPYDAEDMQHLEKMYMSMSQDEQHVHHDVLRKCMDASGMQKCGDMSMNKTEETSKAEVVAQAIEVKAEEVKPNPEIELLKSEVAAEKAKAEDLKKNLDAVQEFLTKLVKKVPQGKAITAYEQVAKSEGSEGEKELSKTEVKEILSKKAADPTLTKSDRDAINAFYLNGANINTISHLLK